MGFMCVWRVFLQVYGVYESVVCMCHVVCLSVCINVPYVCVWVCRVCMWCVCVCECGVLYECGVCVNVICV